jgi:hypothetical protein
MLGTLRRPQQGVVFEYRVSGAEVDHAASVIRQQALQRLGFDARFFAIQNSKEKNAHSG